MRPRGMSLVGQVRQLAFDKQGCRAVQAALEAAGQQAAALAAELRGCVREAVRCPHANYVIQKVVQCLPPSQAGFVAEELLGKALEVAKHPFGCRVLCRLLEHQAGAGTFRLLLEELLSAPGLQELVLHGFGHHVLQAILEHGEAAQRARVVAALPREPAALLASARHRHGCFVVEKALLFGEPALLSALLQDRAALLELAEDQFGARVVMAMLRLPAAALRRDLDVAAERLSRSKYGRRVLAELRRSGGCAIDCNRA